MPIEVFEQLNSRGGICMGLCRPIEVLVINFFTGVFVEARAIGHRSLYVAFTPRYREMYLDLYTYRPSPPGVISSASYVSQYAEHVDVITVCRGEAESSRWCNNAISAHVVQEKSHALTCLICSLKSWKGLINQYNLIASHLLITRLQLSYCKHCLQSRRYRAT